MSSNEVDRRGWGQQEAFSSGWMERPSNRYQYKTLTDNQNIRVLRIFDDRTSHGQMQGDTRGELAEISLYDPAGDLPSLQYHAVSYCWGDPTHVDRVWLSNGQFIPLTASSTYILRRVQRNAYFWMDSVCID